MKCKHVDTEVIGFYKSTANPYRVKCWDCGAWLSLGPANDDDPRVKVEISGIDLADSYRTDSRRPGPDRFDYCLDTDSAALCERCESLYLAAAIANHDENRETE